MKKDKLFFDYFQKVREIKKGLRRKGRVQEIGMEWSERHASSTDSLSLIKYYVIITPKRST